MMAPAGGLSRIGLLGRDECVAARAAVMELRKSWIARSEALPFYTLGAASYIDAQADRALYHSRASTFNPLLQRHFGWLYDKLTACLAQQLGGPVRFAPALARPGYHVYLAHRMFEQPIASIHCDMQHSLLDWSEAGLADFTQPVSYTLPIALPQCGGGLNTWEVARDHTAGWTAASVLKTIADTPPRYEAYALGELVLHSGRIPHQAAPATRVQEGDERITLQGHAIACDGQWVLYW